MEKSNSCKIRNNLNEISYLEGLLYKKLVKCKKESLDKSTYLKQLTNNSCESELNKVFSKNNKAINQFSNEHFSCLSKCTNLLNFPSEELSCYEACEEEYYLKLKKLKINLVAEFN